MSHITRRKSDETLAREYREYLADQDFKANCPFGLTTEEKTARKKKVKRKRKPVSKKRI